jgi:hypothetical protein
MRLLSQLADDSNNGPAAEVLARVDAWANEVLQLRADTQRAGYDPFERSVVLDDLIGSYTARDRLERLDDVSDLLVVKAIDELLIAVTEEAGRAWIEATGMGDLAGQGWWWNRLPIASSQQDDRQESASDG